MTTTYITNQDYEPIAQRSWLKRLAGISIQDEFCDNIMENKNWPFEDYGTFLEFTYTSKTYYRSLWRIGISLTIMLCMILSCEVVNGDRHELAFIYLLICPLIIAAALINIVRYWEQRSVTISKIQKTYEFRRGETLVHKGDLSDLYVRLESHPCTNGKTYYMLVLNGFMCEKYSLARAPTDERDVLDKMGRLITRRNQLNYFDSVDVSTRNIIRHVEEGTSRRMNQNRASQKRKSKLGKNADGTPMSAPRRSVMVDALDFF